MHGARLSASPEGTLCVWVRREVRDKRLVYVMIWNENWDWDGQGVCAVREGKGEIFQIERKWGDEVEKK